jgi:hypothetical protein
MQSAQTGVKITNKTKEKYPFNWRLKAAFKYATKRTKKIFGEALEIIS